MPIQIDGIDLVNGTELAARLGVKLKTVINYHVAARKRNYPEGRGKFPRPYTEVEGHPLWRETDADEYARNRPSALRASSDAD